MIEWYNSGINQNVPGKLLLFYCIEGTEQVWALVHCCRYETSNERMFESSRIISSHQLCFQPSSAHRSVSRLERITIDSISHGVVGIEEVKNTGGKLNSIRTSTIPTRKVMVLADRKNEWASQFMDWGEEIYQNDNYQHLREAFIDPVEDQQRTTEDESLFLMEDHSSESSLDSSCCMDSTDDSEFNSSATMMHH
jgi:hypothetical protein